MSRIKDENYYQISGWMLNKLNLKGTALNVYAIVYGFSQDGESEFIGGRQYICDFTGATKPTIDKALDELVEKGFILNSNVAIKEKEVNPINDFLEKDTPTTSIKRYTFDMRM